MHFGVRLAISPGGILYGKGEICILSLACDGFRKHYIGDVRLAIRPGNPSRKEKNRKEGNPPGERSNPPGGKSAFWGSAVTDFGNITLEMSA